jgi:hypothetical protein
MTRSHALTLLFGVFALLDLLLLRWVFGVATITL